MELSNLKCIPCEGNTPALTINEITPLLHKLNDWHIENKKLAKNFKLKNFKEVIDLTNQIASLAEKENHHPDLKIHSYNQLKISLTTHAIKGLSKNDFILAAKIDQLWPDSNN